MIATSPAVGYIHEPFSPMHHPGICPIRIPLWFTYVTEENAAPYRRALDQTVGFSYSPIAQLRGVRGSKQFARLFVDGVHFAKCRLLKCRPLLKDPIALFSTEWLAGEYDLDVILLVRHPAAFAASIVRHGRSHPFSHFLDQPALIQDRLAPFEREIAAAALAPPDLLDEAALLWRICAHVALEYRGSHPEWTFRRYEDLASSPAEAFRDLFGCLGLDYSGAIERKIMRATQGDLDGWKSILSSRQISALRKQVEPLSDSLYPDTDW